MIHRLLLVCFLLPVIMTASDATASQAGQYFRYHVEEELGAEEK